MHIPSRLSLNVFAATAAIFVISMSGSALPGAEFFVAPHGNDANPGTMPGNWWKQESSAEGVTAAVTREVQFQGRQSLRIEAIVKHPETQSSLTILSAGAPARPGETYVLRARIKSQEPGASVFLAVQSNVAGPQNWQGHVPETSLALETDWTPYELCFRFPKEGDPNAADSVERVSCRPDFMVLVYPVITMGEKTHAGSKTHLLGPDPKPELVQLFSNEQQVTDKTPPTFLAHAKDDGGVPPENSRMFFQALKAHHVAAEYLELPSGGHGLNGCQGPMWEAWKTKSLQWLATQGIIPRGKPGSK